MGESEIIEEWTHDGHRCKVVLITFETGHQHYCGYVQTGLRFDYDKATYLIDAHGGLTYGVDDEGWVGFDTAHAFDVCLDEDGNQISDTSYNTSDARIEWTPEDVKEECEELARQLSHLEEFVENVR